MYICDQHVHSVFSMDGKSEIDEICVAAISRGLAEIVITDHCDINADEDGVYVYNAEKSRDAVMEAKEKYSKKLTVTYGVELGQLTQRIEAAEKLLSSYDFEFVLGSLHNLNGVPDFYFLNFSDMMPREYQLLFERYLNEITALVDHGGFNSLAHITYPLRYLKKYGKNFDISGYNEVFREIFKKLINSGICLEVNTSGIRQELKSTIPDDDILMLYRDVGGKLITVGSDAHKAADAGADIADTYKKLSALGFEYITLFHGGKEERLKIS